MPVQTLKWHGDALVLLDQTRLPQELVYETCRDVETVAQAIEVLMVRGAPAIGLAAAYGVVVGAFAAKDDEPAEFQRRVKTCLLYTSPSPRDKRQSRMPSSA